MKKQCKVCGATYDTRYSCERQRSWRMQTDTADHYYILVTMMAYKTNRDAQAAYDALTRRGIDPTKTDGFMDSVRSLMEDMLANLEEAEVETVNESGQSDAEVTTEEPTGEEAESLAATEEVEEGSTDESPDDPENVEDEAVTDGEAQAPEEA